MVIQRDNQSPTLLLVAAFAAIYFIWGSTYLAIRYAVETLPPFWMAGTRALVGGLLLFAIARQTKGDRLRARHWRSAIIAGGLLFVGGHGLLSWAEQYISSGGAALAEASIPIWIILLRIIPRGPAPNAKTLLGVTLGITGVVLLVVSDQSIDARRHDVRALVAVLLSAISWSVGSLYARRAVLPRSLTRSTALQLLAGGALLLITGTLAGEWNRLRLANVSAVSIASLAYLIVFGSIIAFSAYNWLMRVAEPARVGTYAFVNPVVAVILGSALAGEHLDLPTIMGGVAIIAGAVLIHRDARAPENCYHAQKKGLAVAGEAVKPVLVALGTPARGDPSTAPHALGGPYRDATSTKPHLSELTGSPPLSGVPGSARPNSPSPRSRPGRGNCRIDCEAFSKD